MRLLVEEATGKDALDLTWLRIRDVLKYLPMYRRVVSGHGLTDAQGIQLQREAKARGEL